MVPEPSVNREQRFTEGCKLQRVESFNDIFCVVKFGLQQALPGDSESCVQKEKYSSRGFHRGRKEACSVLSPLQTVAKSSMVVTTICMQ